MADFNKAKRTNNGKKWYVVNTKNYQVYFWALPILPIAIMIEKLEDWQYKRRTWDEEKARKVLDKILPKVLEWVEEEDAFCYCMCWTEWGLVDNAPLIYRKWVKKFKYDLHNFVLKGYENKNYDKTFVREYDETWVKFTEK